MTSNNNDFFENAAKVILSLMDDNKSRLDPESFSAIQHYVEHDEYEMAFEGLFIELMGLKFFASNTDLSNYIELARNLGLDHDSVFDENFWPKFISFVS